MKFNFVNKNTIDWWFFDLHELNETVIPACYWQLWSLFTTMKFTSSYFLSKQLCLRSLQLRSNFIENNGHTTFFRINTHWVFNYYSSKFNLAHKNAFNRKTFWFTEIDFFHKIALLINYRKMKILLYALIKCILHIFSHLYTVLVPQYARFGFIVVSEAFYRI